uniref:EMI domain-containing protein n=1 Tax=Magallana gigas TaxID=29159 RepID=A0A8W8JMP2_MAGGI
VCALFPMNDEEKKSEGENWCVYVKGRRGIDIVTVPCTEKIKTSCGWFSISYCTMYRKTYCKKELNTTKIFYYKTTDCCEGFVKTPNNTCVNETALDPQLRRIIENTTAVDNKHEDFIVDPRNIVSYEEAPFLHEPSPIRKQVNSESSINLSQGAYAGIACAVLFLVVIAVFIGIAVRKKRVRNQKGRKRINMRDSEIGERVAFHTSPNVKTKKGSKLSHTEETERVQLAAEET